MCLSFPHLAFSRLRKRFNKCNSLVFKRLKRIHLSPCMNCITNNQVVKLLYDLHLPFFFFNTKNNFCDEI